jgi:hypothetical protein
MAGLTEEEKLLQFMLDHAPATLSAKINLGVVEAYLGVIHDYVEEHNEPVNSPESEIWVLTRFVELYPGFSLEEARKVMDLELEYWDMADEGMEEEEEDDFFGEEE